MEESGKHKISFGGIVATIGSILITLGIVWLIALNWHDIPSALKIFILVLSTGGAYTAGTVLRIKGYPKVGGSLLVLGALLYTLSIFLIAQIFSTGVTAQKVALLVLLAWVGVLIASYIFDSSPSLIIALIEFLAWISIQFIAFFENLKETPAFGLLAIIYLVTGILLFGLTQFHKANNHKFANVYRFWTMFYILALTYLLSFQGLLPILWPENFIINAGMIIFIIIFSIIALGIAGIGIVTSVNKGKTSVNEILGAVGIVAVYGLLITLATLVSGAKVGFSRGMSSGLFFLWIFDNILFIAVILAIIGYGVKTKSSKIINLGIIFFIIDIITRYIGFILDFGGQIGFAVISIIGGVLLLFGGWAIEKWRENLITKTKTQSQPKLM